MSRIADQWSAQTLRSERGLSRKFVAFLARLRGEWRVRRELARAGILDCASLRDIGLAPGGVESAIRYGRSRQPS